MRGQEDQERGFERVLYGELSSLSNSLKARLLQNLVETFGKMSEKCN